MNSDQTSQTNASYQLAYSFQGHTADVRGLLNLSNGNLVTYSDDNTVAVWDSSNHYTSLYVLKGHTGPVNAVVQLQNGNLASCSEDGTIRVWNAQNNLFKYSSRTLCCSFQFSITS